MVDIKIIESGYILADGGAMFGAIPKRAWQRKYTSNADNLCTLAMRCALVISEDRVILIDTGMGDKHTDRMSYYQPHSLINIEEEIKKYGFSSEDVTDVILTHLHFDHCGYATKRDKNDKIIPSFAKATYWLSRKQWDNYLTPNILESDSILAENIQPIDDAALLRFVDQGMQISKEVSVRLFDGHSIGQLVVYIKTDTGIYTFPGDLIPTSAHVPLEWISAYDINALKSAEEKQRFLVEAEKENYTLIYYHDVKVKTSKVKRLNDNYKAY